MAPRTSSLKVCFAAVLMLPATLYAQQAPPPTLSEILQRLEANLNRFDTRVPSLFCDEHVVSSQMAPKTPAQNTVTDSVFRLSRTQSTENTKTLVESREVKTVNGKPATSENVDGPTVLSGLFEGALAVVSLDQSACTNYALQKINSKRPGDPYSIRFNTVLTPKNAADCFLQEESSGRAVIDSGTMQLKHLEITTPHHIITDGDSSGPRLLGKRKLTIDYAPVQLGGESFWMPSLITMLNTGGSGFHATSWSFRASYRNYHRREVTSRLLPAEAAPKP